MLLFLLVVIVIQNSAVMTISLLFWTISANQVILIFITLVIGILIGLLLGKKH